MADTTKEQDAMIKEILAKAQAEGMDLEAMLKDVGGGNALSGASRGASSEAYQPHSSEPMYAPEADRVVEGLVSFDAHEVASSKWSKQRAEIERLNVQAHHNVATNSDEFIKDALILHDKFPMLVHELLVTEAWKEKALPHLPEGVYSSSTSSMAL